MVKTAKQLSVKFFSNFEIIIERTLISTSTIFVAEETKDKRKRKSMRFVSQYCQCLSNFVEMLNASL